MSSAASQAAQQQQQLYHVQPILYPALPTPSQLHLLGSNADPSQSKSSEDGSSAASSSTSWRAKAKAAKAAKAAASSSSLSIRCAEACGKDLFVGVSDGKIHRYTLSNQGSSKQVSSTPYLLSSIDETHQAFVAFTSAQADTYAYTSSIQVSSSRKPIERIFLFPSPSFQLQAVLSESVLTFFHLHDLSPVVPGVLPAVRGLAAVVLDDAEGYAVQEDDEEGIVGRSKEEGQAESISLCLIRRKSIVLVRLSSIPLPSPSDSHQRGHSGHPSVFLEWQVLKEIPLPGGATMARRFGSKLVIATTTDYRMVDLQTEEVTPLGLPISQTQDSPSANVRPSIVTLSSSSASANAGGSKKREACEFLITSHSEGQTLGVFIKSSTAEPTPKLIEWPSHPRSVALVDSVVEQRQGNTSSGSNDKEQGGGGAEKVVIALLRNDTVEVHDLNTMQCVQRIELGSEFEARFLSSGHTRFLIGKKGQSENGENPLSSMKLVRIADVEGKEGVKARKLADKAHFDRARLLLGGRDGLQALTRASLLSQAMLLIEKNDMEQLQMLVDAAWVESMQRQHRARELTGSKDQSIGTIAHLYQVLGFHHLKALRFEAAKNAFFRGRAPVSALLRMFPDVSKYVPDSGEEAHLSSRVPLGLVERYRNWRTIDAVIADNLRWNYAPFLDVEQDQAALMLREALHTGSRTMLRHFLEEVRSEKLTQPFQCTSRVLDNALAYLYAVDGFQPSLNALLSESDECDAASLRAIFEQKARYGALAEIARKEANWAEYLSLATHLIDGELKDDSWKGQIADVVDALEKCAHQELVTRYGVWLVTHDAAAGLEILTRRAVKSRSKAGPAQDKSKAATVEPTVSLEAHRDILKQLRDLKASSAAEAYLEHVALARKNRFPELLDELMEHLFQSVLSGKRNASEATLMQQVEEDYERGMFAESFPGHLALLAQQSALIVNRLKLAIVLQGSAHLDAERMLKRIEAEGDDFLRFERAILMGKLQQHKDALTLLALQLHDTNSAEAYCTQSSDVVSPVLAERIYALSEISSLKPYASFLTRSRRGARSASDDDENRKELLGVLLGVYTSTAQR